MTAPGEQLNLPDDVFVPLREVLWHEQLVDEGRASRLDTRQLQGQGQGWLIAGVAELVIASGDTPEDSFVERVRNLQHCGIDELNEVLTQEEIERMNRILRAVDYITIGLDPNVGYRGDR